MKESVEILSRLIRVDSTNPPGNESKMVDVLLEFIGAPRENIEIINHGMGRSSLIITIEGANKDKCIGFIGHLDTVPIGDCNKWKNNPFQLSLRDHKLYGRGAADMKGGVAAMAMVCKMFLQEPPTVTVKFIFTADEEANGLGARTLCDRHLLDRLDSIIVCEPTDLKIGTCEKGSIWAKCSFYGKASHAAIPGRGKNALEEGMNRLIELKGVLEDRMHKHPLLGKGSCSITMMDSGSKINVIPDCCTSYIDIRITPDSHRDLTSWCEYIENYVYENWKNQGVDCSLEIIDYREAIEMENTSPFVQCIEQVLRGMEVTRDEENRDLIHGIQFFTDGAILVSRLKIPFVILGPGKQNQCHIIDEYILDEQLDEAVKIYRSIIKNYV